MTQKVLLWITVCSLAVFGLSAGTLVVIDAAGVPAGLISVQSPSTFAGRILFVCIKAQFFALPVAALTGAAYIVLLDRQVRQNWRPAFAIEPTAGDHP